MTYCITKDIDDAFLIKGSHESIGRKNFIY